MRKPDTAEQSRSGARRGARNQRFQQRIARIATRLLAGEPTMLDAARCTDPGERRRVAGRDRGAAAATEPGRSSPHTRSWWRCATANRSGKGQAIDLTLNAGVLALLGRHVIDFDQLGIVRRRDGATLRLLAPRSGRRTDAARVALPGAGIGVDEQAVHGELLGLDRAALDEPEREGVR